MKNNQNGESKRSVEDLGILGIDKAAKRFAVLKASEIVNENPLPAGVILDNQIAYHNRAFKKAHGLLSNDESATQIVLNPAVEANLEQLVVCGVPITIFTLDF